MRVAVLYGGPDGEHDVSLASGREVLRALAGTGHRVAAVRLERDGRWRRFAEGSAVSRGEEAAEPAEAEAPDPMAGLGLLRGADMAVLALHGPYGEGGILQGALEAVGVPYTGSGPLAAALAMRKAWAKRLFALAGIAVPADLEVWPRPGGAFSASAAEIVRAVPPPWVVKPSEGGSSLGLTLLDGPEGIEAALRAAVATGAPAALVERRLSGVEVTCAVLEDADGTPRALPPILIRPRLAPFFDYASKYTEGGADEICPAPLPAARSAAVAEAAIACHTALGCRGLSRTDMFLPEDGGPPVVVELNTLPGLTAGSLVPKAVQAAGMSMTQLLERLMERSLWRAGQGPGGRVANAPG